MNATSRLRRESKSERERAELVGDTALDSFRLAMKIHMIAEHDVHGHGNIRGGRTVLRAAEIFREYAGRYGADCVEAKLDREMAERGLSIEVKWK